MKRLHSICSVALLAAATALTGCAGMRSVTADVSSYGDWPAERKPATYAFERLPSQQAQAEQSDALEAAARPALEKAGFTAAEPGREPSVLIQVGAREARADYTPWDDPLWWRGGFGYWRYGPWMSPRWGWGVGMHAPPPRYERQVAVLIRDRASGKPLFEARASSEGNLRSDTAMLGALFEAALIDFPHVGVNPRRVTVALPE